MISRKALGVAGAAMLGTVAVLGANVANAINLDDDDEVITYAKESLTTSFEEDGVKYYVLTDDSDSMDDGSDITTASGKLDVWTDDGLPFVSTSDNVLIVKFTLENMVFTSSSSPKLQVADGGDDDGYTAISGGGKGDKTATFIIRDDAIDKGENMALDVVNLAVVEGGGGSVTMEVSDTELRGIVPPDTQSATNRIRVQSVVSQKATAVDLEADVGEGFMKFVEEDDKATETIGTVGKLDISVTTENILSADDSAALEVGDVYDADASMLVFDGEIGFAEDVTLADTATCAGGTSIMTGEGENRKLAKQTFTAATAAEGGGKYLCIEVDGETPIPETMYTVATEYDSIDNAAFPPSNEEDDLGEISRGGTTVHIPYLTTSDRYNQRLVIVNRGSVPANYTLTFTPEEGTTHVAGDMAEDTVPAGQRVVLSLLNDDVVTLTGRSRTAATLTVDVGASAIDVATVQVNRSNGSTDTVSYQAQSQ